MNKINFCNSTEKKTLQINVVGGLGNQLFLLVFGVCVSKYLKKDLVIQEKLIHFGSNPNRKLAISNFTFKNLHINYSRNIFFKLKSFYSNKFFRKLIWIIVHIKNKPITEIEIAKSGFKFNSNQTYSGYYQDWFYADLAYEIVGGFNMELSEPNLCYNNLLTELNLIKPICVHVRLGDSTLS